MAQTEEFLRLYPTFEAWVRVLDARLKAALGLDSEGLPEEQLRESYQDGVDPADVAAELAELAQEGLGEEYGAGQE
jgi:hypothetical protein